VRFGNKFRMTKKRDTETISLRWAESQFKDFELGSVGLSLIKLKVARV